MTNKTKALSLLLAGTFLSSPAFAAQLPDITEWDGNRINIGRSDSIDNIRIDVSETYDIIYNQGIINNIEGTFKNSSYVIESNNEIDILRGTFENNYAAVSNYGQINSISGSSFINNRNDGFGGAVSSQNEANIANITDSRFVGNMVEESLPSRSGFSGIGGGALYLDYRQTPKAIAAPTDITNSLFEGNHADGHYSDALGGAVLTTQQINVNKTTFKNNYAASKYGQTAGGAIAAMGSNGINITDSLFEGNHADGHYSDALGGAVLTTQQINVNKTTFKNNYAASKYGQTAGGAIAAMGSNGINITDSLFEGNRADTGGAVYMENVSDDIYYDTENKVYDEMPIVYKNIIKYGDEERVYAYLRNNTEESLDDYNIYNMTAADFDAYVKEGGKYSVYETIMTAENQEVFENMTADYDNQSNDPYFISDLNKYKDALYKAEDNSEQPLLNIVNTVFINNRAEDGKGGAIFGTNVKITADNGNSVFSGNKAGGKSNGIYINGESKIVLENYSDNWNGIDTTAELSVPLLRPAQLVLDARNGGMVIMDDGIDGKNYNINVTGDGSGVVKFNNLVENVTNFTLSDNSVVHLGLNADIQTQKMSVATGSSLVGKNTVSSPIITVDVEVDKAANKVNSGAIHVDNDVSGDYRVLVNALNSDVLDNKEDAVVPFLFAPEDKEDTASSFSVARVIGSPYLWDGSVNSKGEETGSTWYLNLTDIVNPDYKPEEPENPDTPDVKPSKPVVRPIAPEVIAGMGLHEAAIEQTRSVVRNVRNKVAAGREYCPNCGIYSAEWDGKQLRNVWVLAQGETATIDKPVKADADIWGVEAGFDVQNDVNNTLGVFASYRKGEYDLSGKGSKVRSTSGSEIDIDSYLAGLYYRYDKNMNWLFATVYGGVQQADAKTDDKIAKFDTDGIEFGAGIEVGHTFALSNDLTLDPSLGVYYTQINFDDAKDNVGKEYDWKDVKHLEAELGAKLEKQIDYAKIYVKPSVIQTITSGDSVKITGLNKLSTYDDATLGRIELGGRYGFSDALSAYGWVNYTFGSDYDATAFGAGLNYAW